MPEAPRRLVHLHVSPPSERARWVLAHHGLEYESIQHVPFLGERRLRRMLGTRAGRATVPVLLVDGQLLTDSWDIALYADREGSGAPLIGARQAEVRAYNDLAARTTHAGRGLIARALLDSPEALDETLPREVPAWFRPLLRPVTRYGAAWFARKYDVDLDAMERYAAELRATLVELRAALARSSPYLLGSFSYADIIMAVLLQGVSPVADEYLRLGPATRRVWTRDALAAEFADLLPWRDELYAKHRKKPERTSPSRRLRRTGT
jgi:glutathione S-transferase